MTTNSDGSAVRVTIGRGRDTHDQHPSMARRTACGKVWTDECAPDAATTCKVCRAISANAAR